MDNIDIKNTADAISTKTFSITSRSTQSIQNILDRVDKVDGIEQDLSNLSNKEQNDVDELNSQIDTINQNISNLVDKEGADITSLRNALNTTNQNLSNLSIKEQNDFTNLQNSLSTTNQNLTNLTNKEIGDFGTLSNRINTINQNLSDLSTKEQNDINSINNQISTVNQNIINISKSIPYSMESVSSNTDEWEFSGSGYNPSHIYEISIFYDDEIFGHPAWVAVIRDETDMLSESVEVQSENVSKIIFSTYFDITAVKTKIYQLLNHSINSLEGLYNQEWVWQNGETGTPYYDFDEQCWYVNNPNWPGYTPPVYDSGPESTQITFTEEVTNSAFVTLTSITDQGDGSYYYTFEDAGGMSYYSYGYPNAWEFYNENYNYYSPEEISPETEIGTQFMGWYTDYAMHICNLTKKFISGIKLNLPDQISDNKSRDPVVKIDLSPFDPNDIPLIIFNGTLINSLPTFTNRLYLLKFLEVSTDNFAVINML